MYNSIIEAVYQHSKVNPDKPAAADAKTAYSYKQLLDNAVKAAAGMRKLGLKKGDRVMVECTQTVDFLVLDLGCEILGCIFVPIEKKADFSRVSGIYSEVGASAIIGITDYSEIGTCYAIDAVLGAEEKNSVKASGEEADGEGKTEAAVASADDFEWSLPKAEETAEVLFTTGTTGQPKGIIISHRANIAIAENISFGTEMKKNAVEMIPLPLSHSHGLRTCYANFLNGSAVVIMDGVMNVGLFFQLIEKYQVNALDITPTLAKLLFKIAKKGLEKYCDVIDYIEIGTAVLETDVKEDLKATFPNTRLYNFYGSTEAGRSCVLDFNKEDAAGCIGYPSKNASFLITDENRQVIESSAANPGLVAVSGSMMMDGYWGSEELTKATLVDGILYCSDLGYIDEKGRVYVLGRADDIINYKGIKIAPEEIEGIAAEYAGVKDCACVPIADEICGQKPKLFISVTEGVDFDTKEYMKYLKERLDIARVPAEVEIIDEIPRTYNGKLQRKKLRK